MKNSNLQSPLDGILLLNKSEGMTSNTALQKAKRLLNAKKAGHSGSLDPLATGMLPICFGEATKVCQYLLDADKYYEATGQLGIKTNTADSTGHEIEVKEGFQISEQSLHCALEHFRGRLLQIPSMFSALKYKGTPLYRYARNGIEVERAPREVIISELTLERYNQPFFSIRVLCSKGTYIRNLVEDIGDSLGVGAHVIRLHRTYTFGFQSMPMYSLSELEAMSLEQRLACLIPMDKAVDHLPFVVLSDEEVNIIRQGRSVIKKTFEDVENCVRLYNEGMQFIGFGERLVDGDVKAKRLLSFKPISKIEQL